MMKDIEDRANALVVLDEQLRDVGFSSIAREFPRDEIGLRTIAAWIGCTVEQLPVGARYYPNAHTKTSWERVHAAVLSAPSSTGLERPASNREVEGSSPSERAILIAGAMRQRRKELIAQPLDRIWLELAVAAQAQAAKLRSSNHSTKSGEEI